MAFPIDPVEGQIYKNYKFTSNRWVHDISQAGTGVLNGHISDGSQTIAGTKTFSNSVGIGNPNPVSKLDVNGDIAWSNSVGINRKAGSFGADSNWGMLVRPLPGTIADFAVFDDTGTAARFAIAPNGNILMGTTVDSGAGLNVKRDIDNNWAAGFQNTSATGYGLVVTHPGNDLYALAIYSGVFTFWVKSNGNTYHAGYTNLGAGSPAIKMKKLTGTTASSQGGVVSVAHGLTAGKIISCTALVFYTATDFVSTEYTYNPGYQFGITASGTNVNIVNDRTNSGTILSKPFVITVFYEG